MKKLVILSVAMMCLSFNAFATWSATADPQGNWYARNGSNNSPSTVYIPAKNRKQARKLAKKLNNLESKDGFKDDGDCPTGLLC